MTIRHSSVWGEIRSNLLLWALHEFHLCANSSSYGELFIALLLVHIIQYLPLKAAKSSWLTKLQANVTYINQTGCNIWSNAGVMSCTNTPHCYIHCLWADAWDRCHHGWTETEQSHHMGPNFSRASIRSASTTASHRPRTWTTGLGEMQWESSTLSCNTHTVSMSHTLTAVWGRSRNKMWQTRPKYFCYFTAVYYSTVYITLSTNDYIPANMVLRTVLIRTSSFFL